MKKAFINTGFILSLMTISACQTQKITEPLAALWKSDTYAIYPDSVVQGEYVARAVSPTKLTSNYRSPANEFQSPRVTFKFAINGRDNEMRPGVDHHFNCMTDSKCETPLITFGQQFNDKSPIPEDVFMPPNTELKIRLDMRPVLKAFQENGFYTSPTGDKIYKEDFKGVYIAGSTAPLSWDFDNLGRKEEAKLTDKDSDGIYEITLMLNSPESSKATATRWELENDISQFPQFISDYPLIDALYNMSLDEMQRNLEQDSTFRTGKEWAGVWTRDISYSVILGMAQLQPKVSMYSLMRKVKNDRIIQDTGTGGAYPVSTDRIVWSLAAWEIFKVTGDQEWLNKSYQIIKNSLLDDYKNAYDPKTGLVKGESSFLDWREQTYPRWMEPSDIYESMNLGTNAVHYQVNRIAAQMAELVNDRKAVIEFNQKATAIREGINKMLWQNDKGYYGQYLYGKNFKILSPRSEALGEALAVLYGVADDERQQTVVAKTPVMDYGIPSIYPQIPGIPPYHNNGIWPFVQAYWSLAAAKSGNEKALTESLSALYRPAALFLTNKENFVASTGDYAGTQINSDRQLWSVAGNLGMVYKVFFGMDFQPNQLVLNPFVPKAFKGTKKLNNFTYRKGVFDIELIGYGNQIQSITLDSKPLQRAVLPSDLTGKHTVKIVLADNNLNGEVNQAADYTSPEMPKVTLNKNILNWPAVKGAVAYQVIKNGEVFQKITENTYAIKESDFAEYMVIALDQNGVQSFASEPLIFASPDNTIVLELESIAPKSSLPYREFSGKGFIEISKQKNIALQFRVTVPADGLYSLDFRYANGNGPINTDNKAAFRTLKVDNEFVGTVVLPQRGVEEWSNWGFTNSLQVSLKKGSHTFNLTLEPHNENMNIDVNQAMLDYLRLQRIR